ncbi:MAG: hypothetical protein LW629_01540 [Burkholderiales bacterium]|nr:hypothetical protein [Burkholderiales bacterium]
MKTHITRLADLTGSCLIGGCLLAGLLLQANSVDAAKLMVLEARGAGLKTGMSIDSEAPITLKEGERVTVIGPDGKSTVIKGPFTGEPIPKAGVASDPKVALAALVATRDARTSSVGVIRAGTDAVKIPEPWLVDITRAGPRCLQEGELPVWWRPETTQAQSFTVFPIDRSWRADFNWEVGQDRQTVPPLSKFEGANVFVIRQGEAEFAISLNIIPKGIDNNMILSSWMLEKGCIQQADALLTSLKKDLDTPK